MPHPVQLRKHLLSTGIVLGPVEDAKVRGRGLDLQGVLVFGEQKIYTHVTIKEWDKKSYSRDLMNWGFGEMGPFGDTWSSAAVTFYYYPV